MSNYDESGPARLALVRGLAVALTAETGEEWTLDESAIYHAESWRELGDPAGYSGGNLVRTRDGFAVRVAGSKEYNKGDRCTASIAWPSNPTDSSAYGSRRMRDAPGMDYNQPEPGCTFAATRLPVPVARQIIREMVTDETAAAWQGIEERNRVALAAQDVAGEWRAQVGAALCPDDPHGKGGIRFNECQSQWFGPSAYTNPVGLDLADPGGKRPGGKVEIRLPDDPAAAARIVAAIRAAVIAEMGDS